MFGLDVICTKSNENCHCWFQESFQILPHGNECGYQLSIRSKREWLGRDCKARGQDVWLPLTNMAVATTPAWLALALVWLGTDASILAWLVANSCGRRRENISAHVLASTLTKVHQNLFTLQVQTQTLKAPSVLGSAHQRSSGQWLYSVVHAQVASPPPLLADTHLSGWTNASHISSLSSISHIAWMCRVGWNLGLVL